MSPTQEQLTALGGVFLAAVLVDKIAKTGQVTEAGLTCMLGSLLSATPRTPWKSTVATTSPCVKATAR